MLSGDLFTGELVRLCAMEPDSLSPAFSRWQRNSAYWRLMSTDAAHLHSSSQNRRFIEKELFNATPNMHWFAIQTLQDDRMIGDIDLSVDSTGHGESFVGIAIGEPEYWGKGYGTDAMRIILRYAFTELNFQRVSLNVFEYNPRAVRSYEKVGFQHEGRERSVIHRDGRRWDILFMGILRSEWEACQI